LKSKKHTLFCPGIPGAGKTVLTAIVIHDLYTRFQMDPNVAITYIYCNYQRHDKQTLEHLLSSLLKQLVQRRASIPGNIKALYGRHKDEKTRPSLSEITILLQSAAAIYSTVFIIVDALDECQTIDGCRTNLLWEIFNLQNNTGANIFATSRYNDKITEMFDGCVSLKISANDNDVKMYLRGQMRRLQSDILDDEIRQMIESEIIKAVNGM
jgi:Cdc6-like AAA superfamily ATPase